MMETGRSSSSTKNTLDPATQQIQWIRANQLSDIIRTTGGLESLARPRTDLVGLSPTERALFGRITDAMLPFQAPGHADPFNVMDRNALAQLQGLGNVDARVNEAMRVSQPGLNELRALTDPTAGVHAAQDYLRRIVAPELTNTLTAAGFGRSGAIGEAIANAGAQLALPVWERTHSAGRDLASAMLNIPGTALGRALDAQSALANLYANLGMQTSAREAQRIGNMGQYVNLLDTVAQIAARPRLAAYEEQVLRPSNLLMTLLTGIPVVQTPIAQRTSGSQSENILLSLIQGAAAGMLAGAMACWIAEAIYGRHSREAMLARYWIGFAWQGAVATVTRGLYRVVGRPVAAVVRRSKTLQRLLSPLFNAAVRRGEEALACHR